MKIIHVVKGKLNPDTMNGINKVVHELATCQTEMGNTVSVIGLSNSKRNQEFFRKYRFQVIQSRRFGIDPNFRKEIINNANQDVLYHIHGGFTLEYYPIVLLLKSLGSNYIFTPHGCYNEMAMKKGKLKKKMFFYFIDKEILKNAWKVQFLGLSEYNQIDKHIKDLNKVLIPNGFNGDNTEEGNRGKINRDLIFGFVGRIDNYHKGLDLLFKGFLSYKLKGGRGVMWIVGDGPDLSNLKDFTAKNDLQNYIKFFGSKFNKEKIEIIQQFEVFVHTSRFEGLPMAVLEAAHLGKPLLISAQTNLGKYVSEYNCGYVLQKNLPVEIEKTLFQFEKASEGDLTDSLSRNSKRMVEKEFCWRKISQDLISTI